MQTKRITVKIDYDLPTAKLILETKNHNYGSSSGCDHLANMMLKSSISRILFLELLFNFPAKTYPFVTYSITDSKNTVMASQRLL